MSGSNVIRLDDRRPVPVVESRCNCRPNALCYPHRLANAADLLRAEVSAARAADWLTLTSEVERIAGDVLAVLDGITGECLTDDETRTR